MKAKMFCSTGFISQPQRLLLGLNAYGVDTDGSLKLPLLLSYHAVSIMDTVSIVSTGLLLNIISEAKNPTT